MRASILLPFLLLAATQAAAAPLTIMVEDASEPFSRRDGTGFANDIVKAAFKAAGIDVRLDVVPYARCKKSVEEGSIPACFAMSWEKGLQGRVIFSDRPLFQVQADIFQRAHAPKITGAADLRPGASLGVINGYEYPEAIAALARKGVVLERNVSEAANMKMLATGRLDGAVLMTSEFENMPRRLRWLGLENQVAFAYRGGMLKSYIGFSTTNPHGQDARSAFNRGYAIIIANHTRDRIREAWLKEGWTQPPGR